MLGFIETLNFFSEIEIGAAGPRYSPAVDPDAPNLRIEGLNRAVEALALTDRYVAFLRELEHGLEQEWKRAPDRVRSLFARRKNTPERCIALLRELQTPGLTASPATLGALRTASKKVQGTLQKVRERLWEKQRASREVGDKSRQTDLEVSELFRLGNEIEPIFDFVYSPDYSLLSNPRLFIRGEWGTGKTHFLCDITRNRAARGLPTLFVLAHRLSFTEEPLAALCKAIGINGSPLQLLEKLDEAARHSRCRALVIIDGINEGKRPIWRKHLVTISRLFEKFPNVGLILSCRTPFDVEILNQRSRSLFIEMTHPGFQEIEFDAQREFFTHYGIPTPQVPLLAPEFSRPLFLKLLCRTFSGRSASTKSRWMRQFASGQRSMTKLFEDFVNQLGSGIELDFGLPEKTCWNLLKGTITASGEYHGLAPAMAAAVKDYVQLSECRTIISAVSGLTRRNDVNRLFHRFLTDGLLSEDVIHEGGQIRKVVRFPYQRFSDHLICRHLLDKYLFRDSEASIRRSFYKNRPLGKIFQLDRWGHNYQFPGLASAVMLEFPERVKRKLPNGEREVVYYLPRKRRLIGPLIKVFLEGLLWRDNQSFSVQTDYIVSTVLKSGNRHLHRQVLEILVCLASREGHPYSGERLVRYLSAMTIPERDLFWSEFLRTAPRESAVYRLLSWVEGPGQSSAALEAIKNLIRVCSMFLTTTHRALRDKATKALVLLGERRPADLFFVTQEMLAFSDPYVPERMLAACYGVLMRNWASQRNDLADAAVMFGRITFDQMFAENAPHATTHILAREYALGVIELARKMRRNCLGRRQLSLLREPRAHMHSCIPDADSITENECKPADNAIHMDFGNYTIGRLVEGRGNYDYEHKEYRRVLRQIKWRALNLGYSYEKFGQLDGEIANAYWRLGGREGRAKIDRYGKKYCWIAFFEVAGMLADAKRLRNVEYARISDVDIDPSFPAPVPKWEPPLKPLFETRYVSPAEWIQSGLAPNYEHLLCQNDVAGVTGPWVLLDGYIQEVAVNDPREVFTFLRGLFVRPEHAEPLRARLMATEYPGNFGIPHSMEDYYVFAGEIPWSNRYAKYLRRKDESAKPQIDQAFRLSESRKVRKRLSTLTRLEILEFSPRNSAKECVAGQEPLASCLPKHVEITQYIQIPGIRVELPACHHAWESYHSPENQGPHAEYVAPAMAEHLKLRNTRECTDLIDEDRCPATLYRTFGLERDELRITLLYLRRDLLEHYLAYTHQELVWINWGERSFKSGHFDVVRDELQPIWASHAHIHKAFVRWTS